MVQLAKESEAAGFTRLMLADAHYNDTYVVQALCAQATRKIGIGVVVTNPFSRDPSVTATAARTIDDISNGRAVLGLGAGGRWEPSVQPSKAALALREAVEIIRRLWSGKSITYKGRFFTFENFKLDLLDEPREIPILIGSISPIIERISGEVADIALIGPGVLISRDSFARHLANINSGIDRALRAKEDVEISARLWVCCCKDSELAKESAKLFAARSFLDHLAKYGEDPDLFNLNSSEIANMKSELNRLPERFSLYYRKHEALSKLTSERIVDSFSVVGTPDECEKRIKQILSYGLDSVQVYLVPVLGFENRFEGYYETLRNLELLRV